MVDPPTRRLQERLGATWRLILFATHTLLTPWPPFIALLGVLSLIGALTPLLTIMATTGLINALAAHPPIPSSNQGPLLAALGPSVPWLALALALLFVDKIAVNGRTFQPYMAARLDERVKARVDTLILHKSLSLPLELFESADYYDQLQRARRVVGQNLGEELTQLQRLVAYVPSSTVILWQLGRASLTLPIVLLLGTAVTVGWRTHLQGALLRLDARQTPLLRQVLYLRSLLSERGSAAEVRLFGLGDHLIAAWRVANDRLLHQTSDLRVHSLRRALPWSLIPALVYAAVVLALLQAAAHHVLTPGSFIALLFAAQAYQDQLWPLSSRVEAVAKLLHELAYLQRFLDLPAAEMPTTPVEPLPLGLGQGITCAGVSFTYPGAATPSLSQIDLCLRPGETIALVGENGAGKSTLAKLLLGLYRPTAGCITVAGRDLQDLPVGAWQTRVAAVFQDHVRYALTIRDNIGFGRLELLQDHAAIAAAAQATGAAAMIERLPRGYDTMLGTSFADGQDLSGGQWQKLALARAYLRDAAVLVLDEPASALDALAEQEVYRQFLALARGKTVVLISHRLGSARLAGRVIFLEGGRIVQQGAHDDLIAAGGPYARLYAMQAAWYRDPPTGDSRASFS